MISFDGADSGMKTLRHYDFIPVLMSERLWNVCGTFVESLSYTVLTSVADP
jgi:hypothetical protein